MTPGGMFAPDVSGKGKSMDSVDTRLSESREFSQCKFVVLEMLENESNIVEI